jgi:hypothetical protein
MINWDKILDDFARKCKGGAPDMTNPRHLALLRESLIKFGWKENATNEFIGNLREGIKVVKADTVDKAKALAKKGQYWSGDHKNAKVYGPKGGKKDDKDEKDGSKSKTEEEIAVERNASEDETNTLNVEKDTSLNQDDEEEFKKKQEELLNEEISPTDDEYKKVKEKIPQHDPYKIEVNGKSYNMPKDMELMLSDTLGVPPYDKFPKKYIKMLARILNSKKMGDKGPAIKNFIDGAGAGEINAQTAEVLTLMAATLDDTQAKIFFDALGQVVDSQTDKNKQIIDKDWFQAIKTSRKQIRKQVKEQYGKGAEVSVAGWDIQKDVEDGLGLDDYENNKGFSTDVYFRVKKPDGTSVLHQVSLKKDTKIFLLNSGTGRFQDKLRIREEKDGGPVHIPELADTKIFMKKQEDNCRGIMSGEDAITEEEVNDLLTEADNEDVLVEKISKLPHPPRDYLLEGSAPNYRLSAKAKMAIEFLREAKEQGLVPPFDDMDPPPKLVDGKPRPTKGSLTRKVCKYTNSKGEVVQSPWKDRKDCEAKGPDAAQAKVLPTKEELENARKQWDDVYHGTDEYKRYDKYRQLQEKYTEKGVGGIKRMGTYIGFLQAGVEMSRGEKGRGWKFTNDHIGIEEPYPPHSTRAFERDFINEIMEDGNEEYRDAVLNMVRESFPLKALLEGEESMALGGIGVTKTVLESIFGEGVKYEDIKDKLKIVGPDKKGNYYLEYSIKIDGKDCNVRISKAACRQRGKGYAAPSFEFNLEDEMKHRLYCANKKQYDKNPEKSTTGEKIEFIDTLSDSEKSTQGRPPALMADRKTMDKGTGLYKKYGSCDNVKSAKEGGYDQCG